MSKVSTPSTPPDLGAVQQIRCLLPLFILLPSSRASKEQGIGIPGLSLHSQLNSAMLVNNRGSTGGNAPASLNPLSGLMVRQRRELVGLHGVGASGAGSSPCAGLICGSCCSSSRTGRGVQLSLLLVVVMSSIRVNIFIYRQKITLFFLFCWKSTTESSLVVY